MKQFAKLALFVVAGGVLFGCGDSNAMTKAEIDGIKNSPKMTDKDRAQVAKGMAEGAAEAKRKEAEWAKENAANVAKINAERAKMGRPPLGG